ncbi:MAG: PP2C family protein-serine/threonine phosphatase [Corynebacterium pyruviciproducens]|uniref:PP2C family protein-serine/threonine phosphatase n=1 Tax=Corynebacterium pyruviciproducens TaxID=598660 RepID=UPI0024571FBE|nr:protein phosphatase 2C domain-containing protein [Corynebacterium pyruviciproducens]MDH4658716.1 serine/threonine-protein phosphatase [Corynebacterium pyruviciproducens]MDK7214225.1 protein phosphatase 2C domain-containing protein [Corynebacterium pyruviciproducens]
MYTFNYAARSDVGLVRGNNEDSAYAGTHLIALADGMGGHAAGEVASQLMIKHIMVLDKNPGDNDLLALLGAVAADGNESIHRHIAGHPETDGMGTTLTALLAGPEGVGMVHLGDSRGFMLRDGKLSQITHDDTYVQSLVDAGQLAPEEVSTHPDRSKLLKAYCGIPVEPLLKDLDLREGDRVLLCSDGLTDPVTASTIETTLSQGTPQEAADTLVELALRSGGPDNVTVVVADIAITDDEPERSPLVVGALDTEATYNPNPNTAAGRAALAGRAQPEVIPPAAEAQPEPKKRHATGWIIALVAVLVVALGGFVGWRAVTNNYYVAADGEAITIYNGVNIAGLSHVHQRPCLDESGNISLDDTGSCHQFTLSDLPEDARASIAGLPDGSYDDALGQVRRLADSALPVCVTRTNQDKAGDGDLATPGVNCREVK